MSLIKSQILTRLGKHTQSKSIEIDLDYLVELQKEQAPYLKKELIEFCVIEGFVKMYDDKTLDYLLYEYMGNQFTKNYNKTAA